MGEEMKAVVVFCRMGLIGLAWLFLQSLYITWDGLRIYRGKADVAVVLGNTVLPDSSLSPWLRGRVDEALRLYRNRQVKKIFVSGGIAKRRKPEGTAMRDYLLSKGVDANDVIADNKGINTYYTVVNFMAWNQQQQFHSAVMVSSFYHITRCKYIMKKQGFNEVHGSPSATFFLADCFGIFRDAIANLKYRLAY